MLDEAKIMPDFKSEPERQAWITAHADYFTIADRADKIENIPTLEQAQRMAQLAANVFKHPFMVYAVYGPYDTYVSTANPEKSKDA